VCSLVCAFRSKLFFFSQLCWHILQAWRTQVYQVRTRSGLAKAGTRSAVPGYEQSFDQVCQTWVRGCIASGGNNRESFLFVYNINGKRHYTMGRVSTYKTTVLHQHTEVYFLFGGWWNLASKVKVCNEVISNGRQQLPYSLSVIPSYFHYHV